MHVFPRTIWLVMLTAVWAVPAALSELPDAQQMAGMSGADWARLAVDEADRCEDPFESARVRANAAHALCQNDVADDAGAVRAWWRVVSGRLANGPFEAEQRDRLRFTWIYVLARMGDLREARGLAGQSESERARLTANRQILWGLAERGNRVEFDRLMGEWRGQLDEADWWPAEVLTSEMVPLYLVLGDRNAARGMLEQIEHPIAQVYGYEKAAETALDLGETKLAKEMIDAAVTLWVMEGEADDMWMAGQLACTHARLGEIGTAQRLAEKADTAHGQLSALVEIALAYHRLGDEANTDAWFAKAADLVNNAKVGQPLLPGDKPFDAFDLARLWQELARAYHDARRFDQLAELYERCGSPLNRGSAAASIGRRIILDRWLEKHRKRHLAGMRSGGSSLRLLRVAFGSTRTPGGE